MITSSQVEEYSRMMNTNTTVVAREYLQLVFLQHLYELDGSQRIFFKGGTAIRFLMGGFRFSEDLDFTSESSPEVINDLVIKAVDGMEGVVNGIKLKEKKTIAGKGYLLTLEKSMVDFPIYVRLDFSFRENVLQKEKDIIESDLPVIFSSFVHHMGGEEILAEKTRALLSRYKGRDMYDYWLLLSKGYQLNDEYVKEKMAYYNEIDFSWKAVMKVVDDYPLQKFKEDLVPFIPLKQRAKIDELFEIVKGKIRKEIEAKTVGEAAEEGVWLERYDKEKK